MNMNIDYSRTINQNWRQEDDKSCWSRRSKLEICLSVSLLLIVALAIGVFAYIALNRKEEPIICITQECLLAASEILTFIDPNVDPCDDFFKFSCQRFIESMHGDEEAASQLLSIEALAQRQLKEIIEEPVSNEDHYLIRNQKELFQACMNESGVEEKSLDIFKQTLEEIDGWPVVVGYEWLARRFDWKDMIYELRNRGYEYNMLLSVSVTWNPDDSNQHIVTITKPILHNIKNRELYKNYMINVVKAFGATDTLAKNEMGEVLVFMEKLNNITEDNNYNDNFEKLTVEEFQDNHNEIEWLDFINTVLSPVEGITSEDTVLFPSLNFMENFFYLIHRTPRRVQANYIIWSVLEDIMPYLPKEIKQIHKNYMCALEKQPMVHLDRFDECKVLIEKRSFPKPTDIIYARRYLSQQKKKEIKAIYEDVKAELMKRLSETSWLDEESKKNSLEKADALKISLGFQEDYFNDTIFKKFEIYYEDINNEAEDNTFLNMYLNVSQHSANTLYSLIHIPVNESLYEIYENGISYYEDTNTLVMKATALQGIIYNSNRPFFMNYGTLGSKIGQELMRGFDLSGSEYNKDGNSILQWSNKTREAFEKQFKCFTEEIETNLKEAASESLEIDTIKSSAGAKLSYSTYQNWILKNEEEPQLPGVSYTPKQLFWVSTILPECHTLIGDSSEGKVFEITAPMRHSWDFAQDFECSTDSKMNPSEKCKVY